MRLNMEEVQKQHKSTKKLYEQGLTVAPVDVKQVLDLYDTIEALQQENEQLRAQVGKPTIEQVAWIAKCICQNADEQGTFRHLIYDIMGYSGEAYQPLCEAGLLRINNSMTELTPEQVEALQQENEQLQAKLEDWKHEVQCHMDEVVARDKEIEKLRAQVARMREALKQAGKAIYDLRYTLNYFKNKSGLKPYDNMTQAQEALAAIDKVIGGKEE